MGTIRVLARSSVNPGGINLGDVYRVLYEAPTAIVMLSEQLIGITLRCPIELPECCDLRVELERCGEIVQKTVSLLSVSSSHVIFKVIE